MKRLTKAERKMVVKAAAMIHNGDDDYCCFALNTASGADIFTRYTELTHKFAEWAGLPRTSNGYEQFERIEDPQLHCLNPDYKEARVLMLLSFAEVG